MKKVLFSLAAIALFVGYSLMGHSQAPQQIVNASPSSDIDNDLAATIPQATPQEPPKPVAVVAKPPQTSVQAPAQTPAQAPVQQSPQPVASAPKKLYKDGEYTGSVADAFFGNLQVKATVTDGKISDVVYVQFPNDRPTSTKINVQALPVLKSEAIQKQSAQVDSVSGATQSSGAFQESLAFALQQAKN